MNARAQVRPREATPAPRRTAGHFGVLRRKCACGGSGATGECEECQKKSTVQRRAMGGGSPDTAPPVVHEVLGSAGQPLDRATRGFFEPRFGHDFSKVRIHTGGRAAESARSVQAHAYTVGRNVVFGAGQYAPGTPAGNRLLAHELAHVVQQGAATEVPAELRIGGEADASETAAEDVARSFAGAGSIAVADRPSAPGVLRRAAIHTGRILDEGSCADLVAGSKWICCDPDKGFTRAGKTKDIDGTACPSQKFSPIFTCDNNCDKAKSNGCSDSDNWMAIPKSRFTNKKCGEDLVICSGGKSTHAYVRDRSEREAWEVSKAIPAALGIPPDFSGSIYPDQSDPGFKKDKACGVAASSAPSSAPSPSPAPAPAPAPKSGTGTE